MIADIVILGRTRSCYSEKWGTPRQGKYCSTGTAIIEFNSLVFSKENLFEFNRYSHVIVIFIFNLNKVKKSKTSENFSDKHANLLLEPYWKNINAKITPPRIIDGQKRGCLATRSPHRPVPVGLTVCRIERIELNELKMVVTGIDIVDKTPIVEIVPYTLDCIVHMNNIRTPSWVSPEICNSKKDLHVYFSLASFFDITSIAFETGKSNQSSSLFLEFSLGKEFNLFEFIIQVLKSDTRSRYSKKKGCNQIFGIRVLDKFQLIYQHIHNENFVRVIRFVPSSNRMIINLNPRTIDWFTKVRNFIDSSNDS